MSTVLSLAATSAQDCRTRVAAQDDAAKLSDMYVAAFGPGGVIAPGNDPYPEPLLFTEAGMKELLGDKTKTVIVAEQQRDAKPVIAGAGIISWMTRYNLELVCLAVSNDFRGHGIGSKLVQAQRRHLEQISFGVNSTELVTHSLMSQSSHFRAGFNRISGFGFCHYPRVFFKDHPESVLWVVQLEGRVTSMLRQIRKASRTLSVTSIDDPTVESAFKNLNASEEEQSLVCKLLPQRQIYVPLAYSRLVRAILNQFNDVLSYQLERGSRAQGDPHCNPHYQSSVCEVHTDQCGDYPWGTLRLPPSFNSKSWESKIDDAIDELKRARKQFILAKLHANAPTTPAIAAFLNSRNFVFHSVLPLQYDESDDEQFKDMLCLQWIHPDILATNALPGETESVVKLYGYPENLSGNVLQLIRSELDARV